MQVRRQIEKEANLERMGGLFVDASEGPGNPLAKSCPLPDFLSPRGAVACDKKLI